MCKTGGLFNDNGDLSDSGEWQERTGCLSFVFKGVKELSMCD